MKFISIVKTSPKESSKIRLVLLATLAFGVITAFFYPLDLLSHFIPGLFRENSSCILLNVTGMPCPFCGMSRAAGEMVKLNFIKSFYYNPSSIIFFTFTGLFGLTILLLSFIQRKILFNFSRKTLFIFVLVLLSMWVLNIFFGHHSN